MKKLFIVSLFALTAGLYGDYSSSPDQGYFRQRALGLRQGPQAQPNCPSQFARGGSTMPYTTIVNEDQQGPRQQYYYYGADRQRDEDSNDNESTYLNINRDNLRENLRDRFNNLTDEQKQNLRDRANTLRNNIQGRAQDTYFNRGGAATTTEASDSFRTDADRALGQRIRDAIKSGWFSKGYEQVSLDVNNGIVTLRGFVVSLDDKKNVENTVRNLNGVNNVRNQLSIANPEQTTPTMLNRNQATNTNKSDEDEDDEDEDDADDNENAQDRAASATDRQINQRIRDAIGSGWTAKKFETVVLRTNNGIVTIEGFVETFDDQRKLNDEIRKIAGVRSVNNNVQVKDKSTN